MEEDMPILEVKDIHKHFGANEVLKGISFSLEKGDVLGILGSSGGGKTTLLRCINFLERADKGTISVNGKVIFDASWLNLTVEQQRENQLNFGMVFQQFNLFPQYTVLQNVELAPRLLKRYPEKEIRERSMSLIKRVGLEQKIDHYPCQLSGGQQQRVAIARALAMNPSILCFDEPTSALDPELTGEVLKVIRELAETNMTMIVVTHEIAFAKDLADKIIFLDHGIIAEEGPAKEVINNPQNERTRAFLSKY